MQLPCCYHAVAMQLQDFVHMSCRTGNGIAVRQLPCCCHAVAMLVNNSLLHGRMWDFPHVFAVQEEELPLNILCGSYLCCQWKMSLCICRTGNRIAAEQQAKFHFWAGLFSQRLSVSVLIKVLSWIPVASPLTMIASSQLIIRHCNTIGIWFTLGKCARLLMSKWTWMRQSLTFATLLSVFFAPCSILKKRQPAVF